MPNSSQHKLITSQISAWLKAAAFANQRLANTKQG